MKVILTYLCQYGDRKDYFLSLLPAGLVSMAAYLRGKGFDVTLANYSSDGWRSALKSIVKMNPRVAGISLFTHNRADSLRLVREMKKALPGTLIVLGGPHASLLSGEIMKRYPEVDYIIRGEGETAMEDLLKKIKKGERPKTRVIQPRRIEDLDSLSRAGFSPGPLAGVDPNEQFKYLITTRGCPGGCSFCCSPSFWERKVRYRSPGDILAEMKYLRDTYGIIYFSVRDDNFTLKKDRVMNFTRLLAGSGLYVMWNCQSRVDTVDEEMLVAMKRAGLEMIQYGVESGSEKVLRLYDKKITREQIERAAALARRVGVYLSIYLMAGMKGETHGDIRKTVALIRKILPGDGIVSPVALYPGTALCEEARRDGLVSDAAWFGRKDPGLYLRKEAAVEEWIRELLHELKVIRERSWYRDRDFREHRRFLGSGFWVTDILEGDYYLDEERHPDAERMYGEVVSAHPENPWGHLRMGKLKFRTGEYEAAGKSFSRVTEIVPAYYGGWLKLAECRVALGDRTGAGKSVREAFKRNRFDIRIKNLMELLRK